MCGIIAVAGRPDAAEVMRLGLYALQHRGEEAAGLATSDGTMIHMLKKRGRVGESMEDDDLKKLPGLMGVGHVRYSTRGGPSGTNSQPLFAKFHDGPVAIVHNGQISNARELREELEKKGSIFQTSTDTEVILHLMARSGKQAIVERLTDALSRVSGAYSLAVLTVGEVLATRDPFGIRPLVIGSMCSAKVVASESCAVEMLGGQVERDVEPGEVIRIHHDGRMDSESFWKADEPRHCVFEWIYFARPDSTIDGRSVYLSRIRLGERLFMEHPAPADICVPVPDSGIEAAVGYSRASGIPFEKGILRAHYAGRTFIQPSQLLRQRGIRLKLSPVKEAFDGKRVVVVDDSLVRSNTSRRVVSMLREAGASEVHMRISSPPIPFPCYFGIDTPDTDDLIAHHKGVEEIGIHISADSIGFLSRSGMAEALGMTSICDACFTGNYPVWVEGRSKP